MVPLHSHHWCHSRELLMADAGAADAVVAASASTVAVTSIKSLHNNGYTVAKLHSHSRLLSVSVSVTVEQLVVFGGVAALLIDSFTFMITDSQKDHPL